jgi:transposase InsO family protein
LEAEANQLCGAKRYERSPDRVDTRAGSYDDPILTHRNATMQEVSTTTLSFPSTSSRDALTEALCSGAQRLLKRKRRALGMSGASVVARPAEAPNDVWCWDFVFDRTTAGSPLKWLSIVDEFTRECLCLKVDRGITSEAVIDWLAELLAMRGVPRCIRSDNGPEFIARAIRRWLVQVGVQTQ